MNVRDPPHRGQGVVRDVQEDAFRPTSPPLVRSESAIEHLAAANIYAGQSHSLYHPARLSVRWEPFAMPSVTARPFLGDDRPPPEQPPPVTTAAEYPPHEFAFVAREIHGRVSRNTPVIIWRSVRETRPRASVPCGGTSRRSAGRDEPSSAARTSLTRTRSLYKLETLTRVGSPPSRHRPVTVDIERRSPRRPCPSAAVGVRHLPPRETPAPPHYPLFEES